MSPPIWNHSSAAAPPKTNARAALSLSGWFPRLAGISHEDESRSLSLLWGAIGTVLPSAWIPSTTQRVGCVRFLSQVKPFIETMGGHAFKGPDGSPLSASIFRDEIPSTLKQFCSSVLCPVGVLETRLIGSAGKRSVSNDIDISIGLGAGFDDQKAWKKTLFAALRSRMGDCHVKLVGQNISVNYPIVSLDPERQKLRVQIDLIISRNPVWTSWLMSGAAENEIEGVYRNLLLSYLAKASSTTRRKVTISYPGGIQTEEHGLVVTPRSEDPAKILAVLGIQGDPESLADFHGMLDALLDQGFDLTGFEEYMAGRLKRAPEQAQRALAVLRSKRDSGPARRPPGEG